MAERGFEANSIQIEDPMDFLSVSEKEAYMRAHQDTLMRDAEEMRRIREQTEPAGAFARRKAREETYGDPYENTDEPAYAYGETEMEEEGSAIDWIISVAMKAMLAAIIIVGLIMAYMLFIRPVIRRTTGLNRWQQASSKTAEDDADLHASAAIEQAGGGQAAMQEAGAPQASETQGEAVVTTTQLNLRTAPNTETSEVITSVPEGTHLSRIAEKDGWSTILYEGQELYCASEFLRAGE